MADIKKAELGELNKMLADTREELRAVRHMAAGSRARDVRGGRNLRKEIARILTEIRARQIAETKKTK